MRGKRHGIRPCDVWHGITPADAGKTSAAKSMFIPSKDHPRGCGENEGEEYKKMQAAGSPPRMRGKQAVTCRYGS